MTKHIPAPIKAVAVSRRHHSVLIHRRDSVVTVEYLSQCRFTYTLYVALKIEVKNNNGERKKNRNHTVMWLQRLTILLIAITLKVENSIEHNIFD